MLHRSVCISLVAISSLGAAPSLSMAVPPPAKGAPIPVIDLHVDLSYQVNYLHRDVTTATGQLVAAELVTSGVSGVVLPLYIPHDVSPTGPRMVDLETSYSHLLGLLKDTTPYLVPGAPSEPDRVQTWFSFEGAAPFAGHPDQVKKWVDHGVRVWGLVHSHDNALASSAGLGMPRKGVHFGLTKAGKELVHAIHVAGGIIDVSHASDRAFEDIVALARADKMPIVATHSNARAVAQLARNLTDAQIRDVAALGGVVGMNFHSGYLAVGRRATMADVIRHMRHIVDLVGIEHVGIGSDFEGGIRPPGGLEDVRGFPRLANAMRHAGFSDEDIRRIFSGNVIRLLERRRG